MNQKQLVKKVIFGRTGLEVSIMGLGCGGYAKLGLSEGKSDDNAEKIIRHALERGINIIDTAEWYKTEEHIGRAIRQVPRENIVLCSKSGPRNQHGIRPAEIFRKSIEQSLRFLKTDYIDVYELHGLRADDYGQAKETLVPELIRQKEKGNIRFFGVTEAFESDTTHEMLQKAVQDDIWDTMMVGFNILNQSARSLILEKSAKNQVGILGMFAVRHALVNPDNLKPVLKKLITSGEISSKDINVEAPLDFAMAESKTGSIAEIAYRFAIQEQGIHTVLSGTGSIEHLEANINAATTGPLSEETFARLKKIFSAVSSESGKQPDSTW